MANKKIGIRKRLLRAKMKLRMINAQVKMKWLKMKFAPKKLIYILKKKAIIWNAYYRAGIFFRYFSLKYNVKHSSKKAMRFFTGGYIGISAAVVLLISIYFMLLYTSYIGGEFLELLVAHFFKRDLWDTVKPLDYIILPAVKFLQIVMPLSLPFFYFIYKEQKTLAMSNSFWNRPTIYYVSLSLLDIMLGHHLEIAVSQNKTLTFTGNYILFFILLIFIIINGAYVIIQLLLSLNLNTHLSNVLNKFKDHYFDLTLVEEKDARILYELLNNDVESIYQMFFLAIDKNMNNCFSVNFKLWKRLLSKLKDEPRVLKYSSLDTKYEDKILQIKKDTLYFELLFRSILKNQINMIKLLIQNNKIEDAQEAIKLFKDLDPSEENLKVYFYTALHELTLLSYKQDFLDTILDELSIIQQSELTDDENTGHNTVNLIFEKLLILTVSKNDIKSTSNICYTMSKILNLNQNDENKDDLINLPNPFENLNKDFISAILYMVFLTLIKSIELSHYSISGFLIKFLVTNFNGYKISDIYDELIRNINNGTFDNPYIKNSSNVSTSFDINKNTVRYCVEKMSILLYCQQKYALKQMLLIDERISVEPPIDVSYVANVPYLEYILSKIENAKDKYGLICLKNEFFDKIKEEKFNKSAIFLGQE